MKNRSKVLLSVSALVVSTSCFFQHKSKGSENTETQKNDIQNLTQNSDLPYQNQITNSDVKPEIKVERANNIEKSNSSETKKSTTPKNSKTVVQTSQIQKSHKTIRTTKPPQESKSQNLSITEDASVSKQKSYTKNKQYKSKHLILSPKPYRKKTHGWAWGGAGFLFTGEYLISLIDKPTMNYQIGFAKTIWNADPNQFLYGTFIFDFSHSRTTQKAGAVSDSQTYSAYYYANGKFLFGYEQNLGTPYLSWFGEAGGAYQFRSLIVSDYIYNFQDFRTITTFGGTFNVGINIKIVPRDPTSYLFRLSIGLNIGPKKNLTVGNGKTVNINALSYIPAVSFGVRF